MYFMTNKAGTVIALDSALMERLGIDSLEAFYLKKARGEIAWEIDAQRLEAGEDTYRIDTVDLHGLLGEMRLYVVEEAVGAETTEEIGTVESETHAAETTATEVETPKESEEEAPIDLFGEETFREEEATEIASAEAEAEEEKEEALYDLLLPEEGSESIGEITEKEIAPDLSVSDEALTIDLEAVSNRLGIAPEDYTRFLDEYIERAMHLESALRHANETERHNAVNELIHLAGVLRLPAVEERLREILSASDTQRDNAVDLFYATLKRIGFEETATEKQPTEEGPSKAPSETEAPESIETEAPAPQEGKTVYPPIDLSDVEPIRFDFSLEEAAEDLNLPVDLIEEFVHDFIQQAHEETEKMIQAYQRGDLETVQKIGHLLKGTSSNLRITPLANTLYEIQFNEDIERVPELVRNYWGHFLALENQMKIISNS